MAIINKRKSIKKSPADDKLKSKLKETFNWMTEDEDDLNDALTDDSLDDLGGETDGTDGFGSADDSGLSDTGADAGLEDELDNLDSSQKDELDSEVDDLLQIDLDSTLDSDDDLLSEDDDLFDTEGDEDSTYESNDGTDIEDSADDIDNDFGDETEDEAQPVTNLLDTNDLQDIIDSPDSLQALEDALVNKITNSGEDDTDSDNDFATDEDDDFDTDLDEAANPWEGTDNQNDFGKGYKGKDIEDGLAEKREMKKNKIKEDVALAKALSALDFDEVAAGLNDGFKSTVSDAGIKGGAKSNVDKVTDGKKGIPVPNIAAAKPMSESIKKSKMLVKAAAIILKLKEMNESERKKTAKLQFENTKLNKLNALLTVAGDKMTTEVKKKMVESFIKCKTMDETNKIYSKVVNVIKEHNKPSLNKMVSKQKSSKVNTVTQLKESKNPEIEVKLTKEQQRKAYLMGISTQDDMYFNY